MDFDDADAGGGGDGADDGSGPDSGLASLETCPDRPAWAPGGAAGADDESSPAS